MGRYRINFKSRAEKALHKLPHLEQVRIMKAINLLGDNPFPFGSKKLSNEEGMYRIRIGVYRVIYDVIEDRLLILVLRVGHRKQIYRKY